jgi:NADH-quinone oxidoreductase subunit J
MHTAFFYFLAALALYSAYFVVTAHNLFRSALGLIAVLIGVSGMYLLMDAQFLSAVQIMVYVGGIVVLIVYVVLLVSDVTQQLAAEGRPWRKGVTGAAVAALGFLLIAALLSEPGLKTATANAHSANLTQIGRALLSPESAGFILPFEVISLVLIAALIGAITIAGTRLGPSENNRNPRP